MAASRPPARIFRFYDAGDGALQQFDEREGRLQVHRVPRLGHDAHLAARLLAACGALRRRSGIVRVRSGLAGVSASAAQTRQQQARRMSASTCALRHLVRQRHELLVLGARDEGELVRRRDGRQLRPQRRLRKGRREEGRQQGSA